jgi:nicotinate-nucleotide adenylyltransferase
MSKTVGIYGGTFDPIHLGHLITAQYVYELRKVDEILFVPCRISPFKIGRKTASGEDRLNMLKLATSTIPYFKICEYEIHNPDISYTINTLRHLKEKYDELELIIGYDNLLRFDEWKEPEEIVKLAKLIVLGRNTDTTKHENKFFGFAQFVKTPRIDISSSEIRRRVKNNLPINFLVPPEVQNYIYEKGLYGKDE